MNPTAELRPAAAEQTDEDDLMPYLVLDILEKLMTSDHCDPLSAYRQLIAHELGSPEECLLWTRRFFRLFATSQWKRERYAPAFHLDDQNLDPKTWARFPILNGAFAAECEELMEQSGALRPSVPKDQEKAKPSSN
jgi:NAD+ synthase (glutamine-hydrolysing)